MARSSHATPGCSAYIIGPLMNYNSNIGCLSPQFMVLMGAYLLKHRGKNGFKAKDLSSILLSWEYNRVYRHLINLSKKGYIRIEVSTYSNSHRYWLCSEGETVIRAFNQHYWRIFWEVSEKLGGFPDAPVEYQIISMLVDRPLTGAIGILSDGYRSFRLHNYNRGRVTSVTVLSKTKTLPTQNFASIVHFSP